jgi:molybdopterin synthase sulfur carrier subunit
MSKIKINIRFFASVRDIVGEREKTLLLPEDSRVDRVLKDLKKQYPQLSMMIDRSFVALNEEYAAHNTLLKEGDTLAIIPPVSGG